ncbi:hypothetical protein L7F22_038345 [Adiantum nelumboides]|nr:hypothetical protein [Adiantum nelumboides]
MPIVRPGQIDQHGVQQQPQHNQQAQANVIYVEIQEQQELEPIMVHQTEEKKKHEEGWYYDCYQCGQVEEVEALAITREKSKGSNNWKEQKDVRDKVHAKVQKEQVQYEEENNEELEVFKKQHKVDKSSLLPIKEDKDSFEYVGMVTAGEAVVPNISVTVAEWEIKKNKGEVHVEEPEKLSAAEPEKTKQIQDLTKAGYS